MDHVSFLKLAIGEALTGMRKREGGPFGAVIVKDGQILGRGHNTVLKSHDPTAHAEINAIRQACASIQKHHLTGAVLYTNFEPCPMCLAALYWADIRTLYYSGDRLDAQRIGFMDNRLYQEFSIPEKEREMSSTRLSLPEMDHLMEEWNQMKGKIFY